MDNLVLASMKDTVKCETSCELQKSVTLRNLNASGTVDYFYGIFDSVLFKIHNLSQIWQPVEFKHINKQRKRN